MHSRGRLRCPGPRCDQGLDGCLLISAPGEPRPLTSCPRNVAMFEPKDNPNYKKLATDAAELITQWTKNKWYETSTEEDPLLVQI